MGATADPTGSVAMALEHAARLLERDPRLALEQSSEILKAVPNHPVATLIKGVAHRLNGETDVAVTVLSALSDAQHRWAQAHFERGLALADADRFPDAVKAVQRAVELKPDLPNALRTLGDFLTATGDAAGADEAYAAHIKVSTRDPRLLAPAAALHENRIPEAELLLREHLKQFPTDVAALRMLAEVAARLGRYADSAALLERCLELAPSFHAARQNYAIILGRQNRPAEALHHIEQLLAVDARNPSYRNLKAVMMARIGDYQESIEIYSKLLATHAASAKIWMSYGHALGTAGREADAIAAYRRAIQIAPHLGEAYWSLANLKTFRFMDEEVGAMRTQLARTDLEDTDRLHFDFALGKALEDVREYEACFAHYASGNLIRRRQIGYEPDQTTSLVRRSRQVYTREFFAARSGWGCEAPDPIFILGMPRAGSTLLEQILASHSQVEGTAELSDIQRIVLELTGRAMTDEASPYPANLADQSFDSLRRYGEQYLRDTRAYRSGKPFFIDKMPNNFRHIGLIHLILPNAKIIDARREPMACCFSNFKQLFASGQEFTYGIEDIARYYRSYVELMDHWDQVLPGRILRVQHEDVVDDLEGNVRRLLDFCGLPFEPACLEFHKTERSIRTASSEQVRRPIFKEGLDQWKHFEPWLGALKSALGPLTG